MNNRDSRRIRYEFNSHSKLQPKPQKTLDEKIQKSMKTMDIILVIMGALIIAFTVTMIILYVKTGGVPDTLVGCFFGACTGEFGVMGWIKSTKDKYLKRDIKKEDKDSGETPDDDENSNFDIEGDDYV